MKGKINKNKMAFRAKSILIVLAILNMLFANIVKATSNYDYEIIPYDLDLNRTMGEVKGHY